MLDEKKIPDLAKFGADDEDRLLYKRLRRLLSMLFQEKWARFERYLSIPDYFIDRWERAKMMGFGSGTSVYDSCLVLGKVSVGSDTWVGPYTILDGSGDGLRIGDCCAISAGVQIYTHDTVKKIIEGSDISSASVSIGNHVYIGPNAVIAKGVSIGDYSIIGANSLVNKDIPSGMKAFGSPAKIVGPSKP